MRMQQDLLTVDLECFRVDDLPAGEQQLGGAMITPVAMRSIAATSAGPVGERSR